jgi:hypothetical protein
MAPGAYPSARIVAPRIELHFAEHLRAGRVAHDAQMAVAPDAAAVEAIVDAAFWASLRREENYLPRISLAFVSPEQTIHPLHFERPLPLTAAALARVAPAVERAGIHLGVWRCEGELRVWGTTRAIPDFCFVLEVSAPGLLVIKHRQGAQAGKFVNVAVLEGDEIKVVDDRASSLPDCPPLLASMLGFQSPSSWDDSVNVLVQLAVSMRAHGRGGLLLVVPAGSEAWRESIVRPIPYALEPPHAELGELMAHLDQQAEEADSDLLAVGHPLRRQSDFSAGRAQAWRDAVDSVVAAIAGLTAVDGAAVMTTGYHLLAFGAKIARRKGRPQVERVAVTEPVEGDVPAVVEPPALGGTRHLSAAQFVQDQPDAIALVASQDGRFTVFAWSTCDEIVHAHRVETLLL